MHEAAHVRTVAIGAAARLNTAELNALITKLADTDPSGDVRQAARIALEQQRSRGENAKRTARDDRPEVANHG